VPYHSLGHPLSGSGPAIEAPATSCDEEEAYSVPYQEER
jgi:hypothetical protein